MTETVRFVLSAALTASGVFVIAASILGVFRFRFVLNRMHCAAIIDTLGALLVLVGLMVSADAPKDVFKLIGVVALLWIGAPIASHLVARMELLTDPAALRHMEHPRELGEEDGDGIL